MTSSNPERHNNSDSSCPLPPTSTPENNDLYPDITTAPFEDLPPAYEAAVADKDHGKNHDKNKNNSHYPTDKVSKGSIPSSDHQDSSFNTTNAYDNVGSSSSSSSCGQATPLPTDTIAADEQDHPTSESDPLLGIDSHHDAPRDNSNDHEDVVDMRNDNGSNDDDDDDDDNNNKNNKSKKNRDFCQITNSNQSWSTLLYMLLGILPWSLFCFCWTLIWALAGSAFLIFPPFGYICVIFGVTSWRALARVDLAICRAFVSKAVLEKYPCSLDHIPIYIEAEPAAPWKHPRIFGYLLPLPHFIQSRMERNHRERQRRVKNIWARGVHHLTTTVKDLHTIRSMIYFVVFKLLLALSMFVVVVTLTCLTAPFTLCLLPSLLAVCQEFAIWQYRYAVVWLGDEKPFLNHAAPTGDTTA
ncbi:hypothetical protein BGZ94_007231 [Podila epigama]|nr:hypothetical protein BGZ94_007231 [Podila epigama]